MAGTPQRLPAVGLSHVTVIPTNFRAMTGERSGGAEDAGEN